jgi:hypothetical protein
MWFVRNNNHITYFLNSYPIKSYIFRITKVKYLWINIIMSLTISCKLNIYFIFNTYFQYSNFNIVNNEQNHWWSFIILYGTIIKYYWINNKYIIVYLFVFTYFNDSSKYYINLLLSIVNTNFWIKNLVQTYQQKYEQKL